MGSGLTLTIVPPDNTRHVIVAQHDQPLQVLANEFFSHCRAKGLPWNAKVHCLFFDGDVVDYTRTPGESRLEDDDMLELKAYPNWHWMAHAPSSTCAALPCPDVLAPLLEVLGGWKGSGKLAQLNRSWRALVDEWRMHESVVQLTNADSAALSVVASRCKQLRHLTIDGTDCKHVTDKEMHALVLACPRLTALELESCTELSAHALRCIAEHCPSLEVLRGPRVRAGALNGSTKADPSVLPSDKARMLAEKEALTALGRGCAGLLTLALHCCVASIDGLNDLFRGCTRLKRLELPSCYFLSNELIVVLAEFCTSLEYLDLRDCHALTNASLEPLSRLHCRGRLRRLCLLGCEHLGQRETAAILTPGHDGAWGCLTTTTAQLLAPGGGGNQIPFLRHDLQLPFTSMGRSRRSDIRIGHHAPMPFVSSHHLRLYPWIVWHDQSHKVSFEPWIEDVSQNGTYINNTLLGRGNSVRLADGDRIDAVSNRSRGYLLPDPLIEPIPSFTFRSCSETGETGRLPTGTASVTLELL
ncbi:hypothetical protein AB1Y20_010757 [Prymnesium parvum]|uniref:FHA domain-containing protein n=1 Tax=Prymnesium parvum TaxID=97485 RepID=A0AB34IPN1_PRYPA